MSKKRTDNKAYSEISELSVSYLPPWNEMIAGTKSKRYTPKPERELDIPCVNVIGHVNDRLTTAVDYRNSSLLINASSYYNDVVNELQQIIGTSQCKWRSAPFMGKTGCW